MFVRQACVRARFVLVLFLHFLHTIHHEIREWSLCVNWHVLGWKTASMYLIPKPCRATSDRSGIQCVCMFMFIVIGILSHRLRPQTGFFNTFRWIRRSTSKMHTIFKWKCLFELGTILPFGLALSWVISVFCHLFIFACCFGAYLCLYLRALKVLSHFYRKPTAIYPNLCALMAKVFPTQLN